MTLKEFVKKFDISKADLKPKESENKYEDKPNDKIKDFTIRYFRLSKSLENDQDYLVFSKTAAYNVANGKVKMSELQVTQNDGQYGIIMPDSSKDWVINTDDLFD